jgi:hypothetical protein
MFIVDIRWDPYQEVEDSFSYDTFSLALNETEKFLLGRLDKPLSINIYESARRFNAERKLIASLRTIK